MSTNTSSGAHPAGGPDAPTTDPQGGSEDSQKWFAKADALAPQAANLARFRYAVAPESWWEVALTVGGLYGVFVGIPVIGGVWAGITIWHRMRHGG